MLEIIANLSMLMIFVLIGLVWDWLTAGYVFACTALGALGALLSSAVFYLVHGGSMSIWIWFVLMGTVAIFVSLCLLVVIAGLMDRFIGEDK